MLLYYEYDWASTDLDEFVNECESECVDVDLY